MVYGVAVSGEVLDFTGRRIVREAGVDGGEVAGVGEGERGGAGEGVVGVFGGHCMLGIRVHG